jgi:hypothetical protein
MIRLSRIALLSFLTSLAWHATAFSTSAYRDGNELYQYCLEGAGEVGKTVCNNYIMGAVDTLMMGGVLCPPSNASAGDLIDTVIKYLRDNPDIRRYTAASNVTSALKEFYCKKSN